MTRGREESGVAGRTSSLSELSESLSESESEGGGREAQGGGACPEAATGSSGASPPYENPTAPN